MRSMYYGLIVGIAIAVCLGCDKMTSQADSLDALTIEENDTIRDDTIREDPVQEKTKGKPQAAETAPQSATARPQQSKDVREPGPTQAASPEPKPGEQGFQSPLKDIPPPTEEEPVEQYVEKQTIDIPKNWTRVTKEGQSEVWIDVKSKHVIVAGRICLQHGGLEMFICPFHTKEHESVIAVNARSFEIHSSLLAIGANPGSPVQWHPDYKPAKGPVVKIDVLWKDKDSGKIVTRRGQDMIQDFKTKKPMEHDWVFGGSVLETDPETGQTYYYADGGELVCLSNFSTAALDVPVLSSDSNEDLLYQANPAMIPEPGTKVYVVFKPEIGADVKQEKPTSTDNTTGADK